MDFRLPTDPIVTASDASETGGGLVASVGVTEWGAKVAGGSIRGVEWEKIQDQGLLATSALDGYVAIESNPAARRVLESHFPCSLHFSGITQINKDKL